MSTLIRSLLVVAVAGAAVSVAAQQAADHTQHHPSTSTTSIATQPAAPQPDMPMGMSSMPQMQQHVATMQALRTKMAAAKTPAEREALMEAHMKAMQEGVDISVW